ncbi:hypothetical protein FORC066_2154 [Yersinia enterocolitica]|nr:hypothetical protein FORC066_2154 [Yersinia enterocolitica]
MKYKNIYRVILTFVGKSILLSILCITYYLFFCCALHFYSASANIRHHF